MDIRILTVEEHILSSNEEEARKNKDRLNEHGICAINVMSSPGAGKTSLILGTISALKEKVRIAVIEGDIASTLDAEKVNQHGIPVIQINTAGSCHLDASIIKKALDNLPLNDLDLLIVENVGNLVCPAEFALGEHKKVMLLSAPEGHDKPYKYPLMFTIADVVLLNKVDLLPYIDFDTTGFRQAVSALNPKADLIEISCKTGDGLGKWFSWLETQMTK